MRYAAGLAHAADASLEVLTVVGPSAVDSKVLVDGPSATPEDLDLVDRASQGLGEAVDVHSRRLVGLVADALADACTDDDIDLLVLGSRDYGPLKRALASSVTSRLIHRAPCPVLLVPRP